MKPRLPIWKVFLIDLLGCCCLILSLLTAPLPGPGGIPLFFAGLSLLSINHDWAKRLLEYLKQHGSRIADMLLRKNNTFKRLFDLVAVILIVIGGYYLIYKGGYVRWFGVIYISLALVIIGLVSDRYRKLLKR